MKWAIAVALLRIGIGSFSRCKHFPDKAEYWKRWDEEDG